MIPKQIINRKFFSTSISNHVNQSNRTSINAVNFSKSNEQNAIKEKVANFIQQDIIPLETKLKHLRQSHGPSLELRNLLVSLAKQKEMFTNSRPMVEAYQDSYITKSIIFEESGVSLLGPLSMNINAPVEGNMHMLSIVATEEQKKQYLHPSLDGEFTSCFAMTERMPGAGSDPNALATTAVEDEHGNFTINGEKYLITGADTSDFMIIMAKTISKQGNDIGATMFICPSKTAGIEIVRTLDTMDSTFLGGHSLIRFSNLKLQAKANVLGEPGKGFKYAQVRLAPARLTHCMRWLGAARRAHEIATTYANARMSFGKKIIQHQGVSFQLADNEIELHTARLLVWYCADLLDKEQDVKVVSKISSLTKVAVSEHLFRIVDRCMQVLGGTGVTDEVEVSRIFRDVRAFRIYDGTSEIHRMNLARSLHDKI